MSCVTLQTYGGKLIDIVHTKEEVRNELYILRSDIDAVVEYTEKNGGNVTPVIAASLVSLGYLKKKS